MQYLGGKSRLVKHLTPILTNLSGDMPVWEPFCGAGNVTGCIPGRPWLASDISAPLIAMLQALQRGWEPPTEVPEDLYRQCQERRDEADPLVAFVGYGCSFGGKYFGGYARNAKGDNYARRGTDSLRRKLKSWGSVVFERMAFDAYTPARPTFIYADPPLCADSGLCVRRQMGSGPFLGCGEGLGGGRSSGSGQRIRCAG